MKPLFVLLLVALLSGCTTPGVRLTEIERDAAWVQHQSRMNRVQAWRLRGRVALRTKDKGWQLGMHWRYSPTEQQIRLSGPLGGGVVSIIQDGDGATLRDTKGNEYRDSDIESLLFHISGWDLPVKGLVYWVRGLAVPGVDARVELDEHGRLKRLVQQQWDIHYQRYQSHAGMFLPRRIFLTRSYGGGINRTLEMRWVLTEWRIDS